MICKHIPVPLTVEFEDKSYPNRSVRGYPMVRCHLCNRMGEVRDNEVIWSEEKQEREKRKK